MIQHGLVGVNSLLADHRDAGGELGERLGEKSLDLAVNDGDGIVRPLHLDLARGEVAEARQHRTLGGEAHQIADFGIERGEAHER